MFPFMKLHHMFITTETFPILIAYLQFLVPLQTPWLSKMFVTLVAGQRMPSCMCFLVYQKFLMAKTFTTLITFIKRNGLFSGCYFIVAALVRTNAGNRLSRMCFLVYQKFFLAKTLTALFTFTYINDLFSGCCFNLASLVRLNAGKRFCCMCLLFH